MLYTISIWSFKYKINTIFSFQKAIFFGKQYQTYQKLSLLSYIRFAVILDVELLNLSIGYFV